MVSQQNTTVRWAVVAIAALAGAWTLVHIILNFAGSTVNDGWDVALLIMFVLELILAFVQYARERPALVAASAGERFPELSVSRFFLASAGSAGLWFVVRMYVGTQWLLAGWEKITSPAWGTSGKAISGARHDPVLFGVPVLFDFALSAISNKTVFNSVEGGGSA